MATHHSDCVRHVKPQQKQARSRINNSTKDPQTTMSARSGNGTLLDKGENSCSAPTHAPHGAWPGDWVGMASQCNGRCGNMHGACVALPMHISANHINSAVRTTHSNHLFRCMLVSPTQPYLASRLLSPPTPVHLTPAAAGAHQMDLLMSTDVWAHSEKSFIRHTTTLTVEPTQTTTGTHNTGSCSNS